MLNKSIRRPILRYHGGKFLLAPWIISHFPKHRVYVELFGGGGSVLMRKERSYAEVYNDKWDTVVNVFKVLRDPVKAAELERQIRLTPFSRTEFEAASTFDDCSDIEQARKTILRSFAGFGSAAINGKYATGFRANSTRSGTTPAHDWMNYPNNIKTFVERLQGVVIENRDYRDIIKQQDGPNTLIYADPPYVHATRNMARGNVAYEHELSDDDHVEFCDRSNKVEGMMIISGYRNEIYDDRLKTWLRIDKDTFADGAVKRKESIWLNINAAL